MNNEFKRMQQLAGIKEIKIQDPTKVNINNLKVGDELIVKHNKGWENTLFEVGQIWRITEIRDEWQTLTGSIFYKIEPVNNDNDSHYIFDDQLKKAINDDIFEYYKKSKVDEIKVQDPTKLSINNLEIGDKLLVKHTDPFVAFVFRVGQVWEVVNIDEDYEHYRLVNTNNQTSLGFSRRDIEDLIQNGVFEYYKEPRVNEIKIKNPVISRLVEEIIDLDKDFFKHTQNLWREEAYELFGKYESDLKNILSLPNVDDIMSSYDNMREYLNTQTPDILNNLKEYLKNTLKTFGKQVDEIKIQNPTVPNGWIRLDKEQLLRNTSYLRDEIKEGAVIIDGWEPENIRIYDAVFLVKVNNQYYVEGWKDDEYQIQKGPFSDEKSARKEILKQIDFCMDYWKYIQEIKIQNPTFTAPEEWNEDTEQDPELFDGGIIKSWWTPMDGYDEEHSDRIFLVKKDNQYYVHYLFAFLPESQDGPFSNKSDALKKILQVMEETVLGWDEDLINEITVRDPTIPNIVEFGNKNIEEIKKLVGYEGYTIVSTFKKTRDKDAAYAVFSKLINSTNRKIIVISFDPEFFAANYIKTANINKKTVYYVEI
jgi:hypothetical protein